MREYEDKPLTFGKYKDILICDIPNWYLEFLEGEKWFKEKYSILFELVQKEMKYRQQFDIHIKD
jgi:uncharacterized protein (DUF3820 family)